MNGDEGRRVSIGREDRTGCRVIVDGVGAHFVNSAVQRQTLFGSTLERGLTHAPDAAARRVAN
jgi:hypothetical protein